MARQELKEARLTGEVVALMVVDLTRGGDMPQWARAYQVSRVQRLLRLDAIADYDVFLVANFQFALVLRHPNATTKLLDVAEMLQRTGGRTRPEDRMSKAYLTFGIAAAQSGQGTAEGLVNGANIALRRALSHQSGPYIMLAG